MGMETMDIYSVGSLADLACGQQGTVLGFREDFSLRDRLLDLGLIPGTFVECTGKSPLGDPSAYLVRRTLIAIRKTDAEKIIIRYKKGDAAC